jgi:transcriptional regulator with XRE-family HTH domain
LELIYQVKRPEMESLGTFLRGLRQSRRLTQADVALTAGVGRVTLNRWERDLQQPRTADLEAFLRALGVSPSQARVARSLLDTPETRARERRRDQALISRTDAQSGIGPMPHGGDLLRALRLRRGLTREETAVRVGVREWTLRRWEKAETWPTHPQLHALCFELRAHPAEMLALSSGDFKPPMLVESSARKRSLRVQIDSLFERARLWHAHSRDAHTESLKELGFLALEREAWLLAARSRHGQRLLSYLYSYHAQFLSSYEQWEPCGIYAGRALDLLLPGERPDEVRLLAALSLAKAESYQRGGARPQRGIAVLKHWIDVIHFPEYKAWLLGDFAKYIAQSGEAQRGLRLLDTAKGIAANCDNPAELWNREIDVLQILLWQGKYEQVLDWPYDPRYIPPQYLLLEAEARLQLQQPDIAEERLQTAAQLIERYGLIHLRTRVQEIAHYI